jgi:voltage-gated sodium channel
MFQQLANLIAHPRFERVIIVLIAINAVTMGLQTSPRAVAAFGPWLEAADRVILAVFVVELLARMAVHGRHFLRDPWSVFDLIVVGIAVVPATGSLSVLRAMRVLRVLRLVTAIPSLRRVVAGLIHALPGMGSIALLLGLIFYVFAVIGTKLFGTTNPELFGTLGASSFTLFQAMTFDDWVGSIVKPLNEKGHALGFVYVITFMVVSAFMALNLFIGVVVTALDAETDEAGPKLTHPAGSDAAMAERIDALMREVTALRADMAARKAP